MVGVGGRGRQRQSGGGGKVGNDGAGWGGGVNGTELGH